ncbi:MAG: RpiB/LacA/LacB family sugar-phosphate isomerase, partial [Candidatus Edwardsbacteria bacterium]|nr:RpiB/LacA/LacB family sugar-phosphate isomerase [Candidatus Edwardsbacteria bacterium]
MGGVDDNQIRDIVHKVVSQALGLTPISPVPATATAVTPAQTPAGSSAQQAQPARRVVAIGADHGGYELKESLKPEIAALGYEV